MIRTLAAAVILFAPALPLRADDVQALIARYVEWRGGAAFEQMQSFHERGELRSGGLHGTFEQWLESDGRVRRDSSLGAISSAEAVSGTAAWTTNTSGQIEDLADGGEGDRREASLAFARGAQSAGGHYSLLGSEERDGRTWSVLRVQFAGPDTYDLFISPESGELLGERISEDRKTRFVRFGGWRMISGVRMPFEEEQTGSNSADVESRHATTLKINVPTPATLFARPLGRKVWSFAANRHSSDWIDYEFFHDDEIFIPATVNGHAVKVLLDSGAGITVLDSAFSKEVGVKPSGTLPVSGSGGEATMQLASNMDIRVGGLSLHGITAGVIDLAAIAAQINHPMPFLLGKEVFNQLIIDIDFPHHRIAFRDPEHFSAPPGAVRLALGRHRDKRTVDISLEGRAPVAFDFDLGNDSPLIVYSSYRDAQHLLDGRLHSLILTGGVGGIMKTPDATLSAISIGGVALRSVPVELPDGGDNILNSDRTVGNVGLPVFSRFRLINDYPHNALWLIPDAKALAMPFPKDRSGLLATRKEDRLKVLMVAPGSPAERDGWHEGAEIVAVNGRNIGADFANSPFARWSEQPAGTIVTLTLADGSIRQLTLSDYF